MATYIELCNQTTNLHNIFYTINILTLISKNLAVQKRFSKVRSKNIIKVCWFYYTSARDPVQPTLLYVFRYSPFTIIWQSRINKYNSKTMLSTRYEKSTMPQRCIITVVFAHSRLPSIIINSIMYAFKMKNQFKYAFETSLFIHPIVLYSLFPSTWPSWSISIQPC